jgi:3-phenylpropionate/trans-cinnamate dioxygenase ferredoxin subunit
MAITDTLIPAVDISDKQTVPVTLNGKNILICKANGEFYAVDNQCSDLIDVLIG